MDELDMLGQTMARQEVLKQLHAATLAEIALLAPNPIQRLEEILGSEEGAVLNAVEALTRQDPIQTLVLKEMDDYRDELFDLARLTLRRMIATRRSPASDS